MTTVPKCCTSGVAFCVAPGPSLTEADVNAVRGRGTVIAISDAVRLAPWADVIYSSDKGWWLRHYKAMRKLSGLRVRVHNSLARPTSSPVPGKHCQGCRLRLGANGCWCDGILTLNNGGARGLSLDPGTLCHGDNSGTAAINLSVLLGATRIVLLGYDMDTHKGRRHFYDTAPQSCSSPFYKFRKLTGMLVEPLKAAGVTVVNASRRSALDCFPMVSLDEALREAVAA
jgi:hypothetical protein